MTARFKRKVRKWRGRTSHGGGAKKKRRGGGSLGGRGVSGRHKHKFSLVVSKFPDHYGKRGFYSTKHSETVINVGDLGGVGGGKDEIDLTSMGYTKLLSRGQPTGKLKIKVAKASERAKIKIEKAGGHILLIQAKERPVQPGQKTNAKAAKAKLSI